MRSRTRAFTLVEIMVAFLVAMLLFIVLWNLLSGGFRTFHTSQTHLEAMQVAQLVLEYVENDLQGMILQSPTDASVVASMASRDTLDFHVSRPTTGGGAPPGGAFLTPVCRAERVRYGLTASPGQPWSVFTRNGTTHPALRIRTLEFAPTQVTSFDGQPHFFLQTTVTAVDGTGKKECTLVSLVALDVITRTRLGRYWKPNEYPYRQF